MRGHTETRWTDRAKACAVVVALLCVPFAVAAFDSSALPGPSGGASFTATGGTVTQPVVLTGDNASGTGTLRIRPSDGDSQLALCSAANAGSPEQCSVLQHYNSTTVSGVASLWTNGYMDAALSVQRNNTSAGASRLVTTSSTTASGNISGMAVFGTGGAVAGTAYLTVSGAATSDLIIGGAGTTTTDIRGPILNGGSAPCGGVNAGDVCLNEGTTTNGRATALLLGTVTNCSDGAGAAACTAAPAGSVVIADGATTVVVSTTAVTANSQIFPVFDSSLGTKLGVTCNTTAVTPSISARTAATSFTITAADPAGANPACFSYLIVN